MHFSQSEDRFSPEPKAWDAFFGALNKTGEQVALVITLVNDRMIYGIWAEDPFASSFPAEEDLLITVPCVLNERQKFIRIDGAKGVLLRRTEIRTIEAFRPEVYIETVTAEERVLGNTSPFIAKE